MGWRLVIVLLAAGLAACATAEVVSTDGDVHVLRVDVDKAFATSASDMEVAMASRAGEVCPGGFEKVREVVETRDPPDPMLYPITAVEWEIRCR